MHKLEGLKEGDTVEVTFRGVINSVGAGSVTVVPDNAEFPSLKQFSFSAIASPSFSIKKVEPPIAVGDRVRAAGQEAEVRAIVDGFYVVNSTAWTYPQIWTPEHVNRA